MNTKSFNDWIAGHVLGKRIIAVNFFPTTDASFSLFFDDGTALYIGASELTEFREEGPAVAYGCAESIQEFYGKPLSDFSAEDGMLYRLETTDP